MYHSLLIHSHTEWQLGYFQILAIVKKAAINICVEDGKGVIIQLELAGVKKELVNCKLQLHVAITFAEEIFII